jgi:NADH-quinone oxidoreductase subunit J
MSAPAIFFYVFAFLALAGAVGMVVNVRNAVASAMSLVLTMVALAGIYVLLEAHLVAVFQIMVYGGAIVVLFLFVVMLLDLRSDDFAPTRQRLVKIAAVPVVCFLAANLWRTSRDIPDLPPQPPGFGGHRAIGLALFTDYVLLVEMASLVLLAAIVGALILAKRKIG